MTPFSMFFLLHKKLECQILVPVKRIALKDNTESSLWQQVVIIFITKTKANYECNLCYKTTDVHK